jgi:hypothetical protein
VVPSINPIISPMIIIHNPVAVVGNHDERVDAAAIKVIAIISPDRIASCVAALKFLL